MRRDLPNVQSAPRGDLMIVMTMLLRKCSWKCSATIGNMENRYFSTSLVPASDFSTCQNNRPSRGPSMFGISPMLEPKTEFADLVTLQVPWIRTRRPFRSRPLGINGRVMKPFRLRVQRWATPPANTTRQHHNNNNNTNNIEVNNHTYGQLIFACPYLSMIIQIDGTTIISMALQQSD